MSRLWAYPLLLAAPFLAGILVLQGLTVEIETFHGNDAGLYHLPTIELLSNRLELEDYPAAQTPLFHLIEVLWGKLVGFDLWKLRLLNVAFSFAAVLVLFRLLVRRGLEPAPAAALALLFAVSPYYLGASFTLLTDNLAILFGLLALDRIDRFGKDGSLRELGLACVAMAGAVLTRQSFIWLALVVAFYLLRAPLPLRRKAAGAGLAALALAPFAALAVAWGGLVPPGADPASCGLCTDRPGVGRDAFTLRTVGFTLALVALYAAAVFGPSLVRRLRPGAREVLPRTLRGGSLRPSARDLASPAHRRARRLAPGPRALAAPLLAGALLLAVSPLLYKPIEPPLGGDAGWLWKVSDALPDLLGSSLVFWALVPAGALALALLARRAGLLSLPVVYLAAFLVAALPVGLVYQKYFDPFALLAVALLVRPGDLRGRGDYAGIAFAGVAFVAYAFSFAG